MKKRISVLLATIMVFGLVPELKFASPTVYAQTFPDVDENDYYYEAIDNLASTNILSGFEDGTFRPNEMVTRAQTAKIIVEAVGEGEQALKLNGRTKFEDVSISHWANHYINQGVEDGFINGFSDTMFAPEEDVTYLQLAKMLVCVMGYEDEANENGGWPNGYEYIAHIEGYTENVNFDADMPVPRCDVAIMVNNAINVVGNRYSPNEVEYTDEVQFIESSDKTNIVTKDSKDTYYEFKNPSEDIKNLLKGDIFVIEPCDSVPSGLAAKVKSIEKKGSTIRIYKDDLAAEEVIEDIDIAESVPVSLENITPASGVTVKAVDDISFSNISYNNSKKDFSANNNAIKPMLLSSKPNITGKGGLNFSIKYKNIKGTVKLLNPTISADIKSISNMSFKVDAVSSIDLKASGKIDIEKIKLGTAKVPIGTTGLFTKIDVFVFVTANGKAELAFEEKASIGFKYKNFKSTPIKTLKTVSSLSAEAKLSMEAGLGTELSVTFLDFIGVGCGTKIGVELAAKTNLQKHTCDICLDGDLHGFLEAELFAEVGYGEYTIRPIELSIKFDGHEYDFYISWRKQNFKFGFGECPYIVSETASTSDNINNDTSNMPYGAGNVANGGFAVSDGKYVYYSADGKLYREDMNNGNRKALLEDTVSGLAVDDEYLYYNSHTYSGGAISRGNL